MNGVTKVALLLVVLIQIASARDKFLYSTSFECNYKDREVFNYVVQFWEYDVIFHDQAISSKEFGRAKPGKVDFQVLGSCDGDQIFSAGYESYAEIYHDCTADRAQVRLFVYFIPLCPIGSKMCHYKFHRDLTESWGEETQQLKLKHDNKPFEEVTR